MDTDFGVLVIRDCGRDRILGYQHLARLVRFQQMRQSHSALQVTLYCDRVWVFTFG